MAPSAPDRNRVKAQLATARATLAKAGIPYPWLDAEILVAHVLHSSRERLHSHPERLLTAEQRQRLGRLTRRRAARVPVPYLVGGREFYGHMLVVRPGVLIPRPETELLVELAIDWFATHPNARRVIDLGTGSGAVAIAVAKAVPRVRIEARRDGLSLIRVALSQAPAALRPGGLVLFECDPAQARRVVRLAQEHWPSAQVSVRKDLADLDRVVRIQT